MKTIVVILGIALAMPASLWAYCDRPDNPCPPSGSPPRCHVWSGCPECKWIPRNPPLQDPSQYAVNQGYCNGNEGLTFCYNGNIYAVVRPNNWPDEVDQCIQRHEDIHKNDPKAGCASCNPSPNTFATQADADASECAAYTDSVACLSGLDFNLSGVQFLLTEAQHAVARYCP